MNHQTVSLPVSAAQTPGTVFRDGGGRLWRARHTRRSATWQRVWAETTAAARRRRQITSAAHALSYVYVGILVGLLLSNPDLTGVQLASLSPFHMAAIWVLPPVLVAAGAWAWSASVVPTDRVPS